MPSPKKVTEFARQYEEMYIALTQCKSACKALMKENKQLKALLNKS